ncbi:MAG: hypothetical protein ACYDA2_00105 [Acidimicrobiales bacterium]
MAQRLTRPAFRLAAGSAVAALALAGCANSNALGLVRQACGHVQRSFGLYQAATSASDAAHQAADEAAAHEQLRQALPLAAKAAGESPEWSALSTTLSESSRVPESDLVSALHQQCADIGSGGSAPTTSSSAPGVPTLPEPTGR